MNLREKMRHTALCHLADFHLVLSFIFLGHWGITAGFGWVKVPLLWFFIGSYSLE